MMKKSDNTIEYYNKRASEYEQIYYRKVPERRKEIDDEVFRLKEIAKNKTVLDAPCGTGYWTQFLSETAHEIYAADISGEMINEAKKKKYITPVNFVKSDLLKLPFKNNFFDLFVLGFWFSHHPKQDYDSLFQLFNNITKPDGKIWLIDNNYPAEGPKQESVAIDKFGNNYKFRYLDNGNKFTILKNYFTKNELESIFSHHFKIERLTYNTYYWATVLSHK